MKQKKLISKCPSCGSGMIVSELQCSSCEVSVRGKFGLPTLSHLPEELYGFLMVFVKNRGVIREVERELGISYPTVRARLDGLLAALGFAEKKDEPDRWHVLDMLEHGEITAEEAEQMLRGEGGAQGKEGEA